MSDKDLKKLNKDLVKAIEWACAEYKYLEKFKWEIAHLKSTSKNHNLRKAAHFLRYIGKAERRAFEFECEVGKSLSKILVGLAKQADYDSDYKYFLLGLREVMQQMGIERGKLAKYASWHVGELDKDFVYLKKEGEEGGEKYHQLVNQVAEDIEEMEKWIGAIEASMEKARKLIDKLPQEKGDLVEVKDIISINEEGLVPVGVIIRGLKKGGVNIGPKSDLLHSPALGHAPIFREVSPPESGNALPCVYITQGNVPKEFSNFKNQIVVDLGAGKLPIAYVNATLAGAKAYIAVEPHYFGVMCVQLLNTKFLKKKFSLPKTIPTSLAPEGMLEFLRRLPDNSVSILASGIDVSIINEGYADKVSNEILRVLHPQGAYVNNNAGILISEGMKVLKGRASTPTLSVFTK